MHHHPIPAHVLAPTRLVRARRTRVAAPLRAFLGVVVLASSGATLAQDAYAGPVTELAIRSVTATLPAFEAAREAFLAALTQQPGVDADREFVAVLDGSTFAPPEETVYVGMTQYASAEAFAAAGAALGSGELAGTFFGTFAPIVFTALRPLDPNDVYDLTAVASGAGHLLEIAVRDLSRYDAFDRADYDAKRLAFLEVLSARPGVVAEYQWVSILEPDLVVGMTVYESVEVFQGLAGDAALLAAAMPFLELYPTSAGFMVVDVR